MIMIIIYLFCIFIQFQIDDELDSTTDQEEVSLLYLLIYFLYEPHVWK